MKRIVRNYVVRDPKPIMDAILRGVSNYNAINIKPSIKGQTIFDEIKVNINDVEKTELYVNGLRYVVNTDYIPLKLDLRYHFYPYYYHVQNK